MEKAGVIICNYNKKDFVLQCIESVQNQTFQDFHLYVVDNASSDGSADAVSQKYGDCLTLIQNQENLGGSGGFNSGMREALHNEHDYLVLLDNDVRLAEDCLERLVQTMEKNPKIGIQGAIVLKMDYPDEIQEFGPRIDDERMTLTFCYQGEKYSSRLPELAICDYVPACGLIVRTEVVQKIGVMPEENFIYWDDVEWCVCCKKAGWDVAVNSQAKLWHKGGSGVNPTTFYHYYFYRNKTRFFLKYLLQNQTSDLPLELLVEKRIDNLLREVFQSLYACNYAGKYNRLKSVMDAFLDVLSGKTGRADKDKIRPLLSVPDKMKLLLKNKKTIVLRVNSLWEDTQKILMRIRDYEQKNCEHYEVILIADEKESDWKISGYSIVREWNTKNDDQTALLSVCKHIFSTEENIYPEIWIDSWCNLIETERDYEICKAFEMNYQFFQRCYEDCVKNIIYENLAE